jgi:hypothetical protein
VVAHPLEGEDADRREVEGADGQERHGRAIILLTGEDDLVVFRGVQVPAEAKLPKGKLAAVFVVSKGVVHSFFGGNMTKLTLTGLQIDIFRGGRVSI